MNSDSDEDTLQDIAELEAVLNDSDDASLPESYIRYMNIVRAPKVTILNNALELNSQIDAKYKTLEEVLHKRLEQCRSKITDVQKQLQSQTSKIKNNRTEKVCSESAQPSERLGPYFLDKDTVAPMTNNDVDILRKSHIIDFYSVRRCVAWNLRDKMDLQSAITKMAKKKRLNFIYQQLSEYKKEIEKDALPDKDDLQSKINKLHEELQLFKSDNCDYIPDINEEYDWESLENSRHTANEIKSMWRLYLHPSINKTHWTKDEHNTLEMVAKHFSYCNWDKIANEIKTKRTGFQCFVYYKSNVQRNGIRSHWTKEEDEYLIRVIECCKVGDYIPWKKVSQIIENRTKWQMYQRWHYSLQPQLKKGRFLPEEDAVLMACVEKYGTDFSKAAAFIPGRTMRQLKMRYVSALMNNTSACWSHKEDKILLQFINDQCDNVLKRFSAATEVLPGKNRNSIRLRYIVLQRWMRKHPNLDISLAPRRAARSMNRAVCTDLKTAVENLKIRLSKCPDTQTQATYRRKQISNERKVDLSLVAFFLTEKTNMNDTAIKANDAESVPKSSLMKTLLWILNSNIDKSLIPTSNFARKYCNDIVVTPEQTQWKTYSRKKPTSTVQLNSNLNLDEARYYLPPSYPTLVALKKLLLNKLTQLSTNNLTTIGMKNPLVSNHLKLFLNRLHVLFTLPFQMSNINPPENFSFDNPIGEYKARVGQNFQIETEHNETNLDTNAKTISLFETHPITDSSIIEHKANSTNKRPSTSIDKSSNKKKKKQV